MSISTTDVSVKQTDGWTLVATNPTALTIKPAESHPWYVAVTTSATPPPNTDALSGISMGKDQVNKFESFETGAITGYVYIRVKTDKNGSDSGWNFSILKDQ